MFATDIVGPALVGVVLAVFGFLLGYFVRDPLQRRRQGRQDLRQGVCELLRKLDMAEAHEDHAVDLGGLSERRRRKGALWGNRDSGQRLGRAEAEAELLKTSIKECEHLAVKATGSDREGLRDFRVTLQNFAESWHQVGNRAASYESSSSVGMAMQSASDVAKQEQASKEARAALDAALEQCADERAALGSEMQALMQTWCRD